MLHVFAVTLVALGEAAAAQAPQAGAPIFSAPFTSDGAGETLPPNSGPETGAVAKVVPIPGTSSVVALFPDGWALYSPDGFNFDNTGATISALSGSLQVIDVVPIGTAGVDALLSDGSVYFSPDGKDLDGGGATVRAYAGSGKIASLTAVGGGVDAVFMNGGGVYFSADGLNLGGGGRTIRIYDGTVGVLQVVALGSGNAVVTLLADGRAFYSPDNRALGGGGYTVSAAPGATVPIAGLVKVGGGVLAELNDGRVYLSPDGTHLTGGGRTVAVSAWNTTVPVPPFAPRDSASGAEFLGRLWLSGGFSSPTGTNSCFATCSYFDLWSSTDSQGLTWNPNPAFATATVPNPRDVAPVVNGGVQDAPLPADFYDPYSPIVVWYGHLTAIGATVWRSVDGVVWLRNNLPNGVTPIPGPAPVRASEDSHAVTLEHSLFFFQSDTGVVFRSTDPKAAVWTNLGAIPGFTPRCGSAVFTMHGRIWVEGGGACDYSKMFNDVWSSPDGINWTQQAAPAEWSRRMWPCVTSSGDGITWLVGGYAPSDWKNTNGVVVRYGANHADVWYTKSANHWRQLKADVGSGLDDDGGLEPRHASTCYVTGANPSSRNLVIIGGTGNPDPDDRNARVLSSVRALPLPAAGTLRPSREDYHVGEIWERSR